MKAGAGCEGGVAAQEGRAGGQCLIGHSEDSRRFLAVSQNRALLQGGHIGGVGGEVSWGSLTGHAAPSSDAASAVKLFTRVPPAPGAHVPCLCARPSLHTAPSPGTGCSCISVSLPEPALPGGGLCAASTPSLHPSPLLSAAPSSWPLFASLSNVTLQRPAECMVNVCHFIYNMQLFMNTAWLVSYAQGNAVTYGVPHFFT